MIFSRAPRGAGSDYPGGGSQILIPNPGDALTRLKNEASAGTLESSHGVVTIGVLREVADWGDYSESELFQAAKAIERYYLANI